MSPSRRRWNSSSIGLLHLEHHVGLGEDGVGVGHDGRPGSFELGVADARALAGVLLDQHLVTVHDELPHTGRGDRYPVLVVLELARVPPPS